MPVYESENQMSGKIVLLLAKVVIYMAAIAVYMRVSAHAAAVDAKADMEMSLKQFDTEANPDIRQDLAAKHDIRNSWHILQWGIVIIVGLVAFGSDIISLFSKKAVVPAAALSVLFLSGCWRPFEPHDLQVIESHEVGFLIPFTSDTSKQTSTNNEDLFRKSMVATQQVKIPQQWVPKGFETFSANGDWKPAAVLIKVNTSPETRVWTADPNSGTSNKNEAIWVMTADQVEFSTGWECTAQIKSKEDAVKFLHNYPNGSLAKVMDSEIRSKIQTTFAIEVTDLPMEELQKKATPHIQKVVTDTQEYFLERGITITNLGISGGFVYKDTSITAMMVKVFNAEQQRSIAVAETTAQTETNKKIQLEADSKAKALLTEKQAEADAIKLVADAKEYEIQKAAQNQDIYLTLKRLELEADKLQKWDGKFPVYFMGGGGVGGLNMLLPAPELPKIEQEKPKSVTLTVETKQSMPADDPPKPATTKPNNF